MIELLTIVQLSFLVIALLTLIVSKQSIVNRLLFRVLMFAAMWTGGIALLMSQSFGSLNNDVFGKLYYFAGLGMAYSLYELARRFSSYTRLQDRFIQILNLATVIILLFNFNFIIDITNYPTDIDINYIGYGLYSITLLFTLIPALYKLIFEPYKRTSSDSEETLTRASLLIAVTAALIFNLLLPALNNYDLIGVGPALTLVFALVLTTRFTPSVQNDRTYLKYAVFAVPLILLSLIATLPILVITIGIVGILLFLEVSKSLAIVFDSYLSRLGGLNISLEESNNDHDIPSVIFHLDKACRVFLKQIRINNTVLVIEVNFVSHPEIGIIEVGSHINILQPYKDIRKKKILKGGGFEAKVVVTLGESTKDFWSQAGVISAISDLKRDLDLAIIEYEYETNIKQRSGRSLKDEIQEYQRQSKIKDDFLRMASHQLRTPLTIIDSNLQLFKRESRKTLNEDQLDAIEDMQYSVNHMSTMVSEFLDASKISAGSYIIEKEKVNLSTLINDELSSQRKGARAKKLKFVSDIDGNVVVAADRIKILEVIRNFLNNARQYTDKGGIKVSLKQVKGNCVFKVKDTGIGIAKSNQSELFNMFYRAPNAQRRRTDGSGLGLYISKTIIEAHQGQVIFDSAQDKGSTFGFTIPIADNR